MTDETEKRKREAPISYRPPAALREEFRALVEASGLSANAFITQSVFAGPSPRRSRRPPVEKAQLAELLAQGAEIADRLKRLEALAGDHHDIQTPLQAAVLHLAEIRSAVFEALGRKP